PTAYGLPTSDEDAVPGVPGVRVTNFQGGRSIYSSAAAGAHAVYDPIRAEYPATARETDASGNDVQGILGAPTSDDKAAPGAPGVPGLRVTDFQDGRSIYLSAAAGAHTVTDLIRDEYLATANETDAFGNAVQGILGAPTSDAKAAPDTPGAYMNTFQGGAIYW